MRILVCSNFYPPKFIGGAELIAHYQAQALAAQGHDVEVFAGELSDRGEHYSVSTDAEDGLLVHRVRLFSDDFRNEGNNFFHPTVERRFEAVLESFRPDVVHFHNLVGLSMVIIGLAKRFGARTVLTFHDHWGFCFKNTVMKTDRAGCVDFSKCEECMPSISDSGRQLPLRLRQDYVRLCLSAVDAFVSPSEYLADTYLAAGFSPQKMNVIWYGIEVARFANLVRTPSNVVRFTYIGVLAHHKGVDTLLAAAARLDPAQCVINLVGSGDEGRLRESVTRLGLKNVRFLGRVANDRIQEVFKETDVLVLPSIWRENQPVTVTEAMASGIPVVVSRTGGLTEMVEHDATGLLAQPGDPVDLANQMYRLITDRDLMLRLGREARLRIQGNTFERSTGRLADLYRSLEDTTLGSNDSARPVILCAGERFSFMAREALSLLPTYYPHRDPFVVSADWPLPPDVGPAALFVVDPQLDASVFARMHLGGVPLVVPAGAEHLAMACRSEGLGLTYSDSHEAAAGLAELIGGTRRLSPSADPSEPRAGLATVGSC